MVDLSVHPWVAATGYYECEISSFHITMSHHNSDVARPSGVGRVRQTNASRPGREEAALNQPSTPQRITLKTTNLCDPIRFDGHDNGARRGPLLRPPDTWIYDELPTNKEEKQQWQIYEYTASFNETSTSFLFFFLSWCSRIKRYKIQSVYHVDVNIGREWRGTWTTLKWDNR